MGRDIAADGHLVSKWMTKKLIMEVSVNLWVELNWCRIE
jgi:hypothetical protein